MAASPLSSSPRGALRLPVAARNLGDGLRPAPLFFPPVPLRTADMIVVLSRPIRALQAQQGQQLRPSHSNHFDHCTQLPQPD